MNDQHREQQNRKAWGKEIGKHRLLYPDERLVCFLAANYPNREENGQRNALDIGFGSGRHLQLLMDYGFQAYGVDYAKETAAVARNVLKDNPLLRDLKVADMKDRPFSGIQFDVVIAWGVCFLRTPEETACDLVHLRNSMKAGGRLIVNFRNKESWFCGKGKQIGPNTFLLDESAGPYQDMCYTFLEREAAHDILTAAGFEIDNCERLDLWKNHVSEHHSWWVFWARRT